MKSLFYIKQTQQVVLLTLLFGLTGISTVFANGDFFDFLPKYRKYKSHYQIDKIHYKDRRTIVYFRFVIQKTGNYTFYGNNHPNSWYLRTSPRMRGVEIQFKQLEIKDLRINNETILSSLSSVPDISYDLSRGDVVSFQVHFVRIPLYIRMLDMIEGKEGAINQDKLNCFDILIKTKSNSLLGRKENEQQVVAKFEKSFTYIKPQKKEDKAPPIVSSDLAFNAAESNSNEPKKVKPLTSEIPEPIDYTPNTLDEIDDLVCNTRTVLPDVKFRDNEISFSGRVRALQNIKLIAEYLTKFPSARANLYGHTDIHGDSEKNTKLSRERAFEVKRELVKMGISSERITVFFFGGDYPLPAYKKGGNANRRVEVEPVCPE